MKKDKSYKLDDKEIMNIFEKFCRPLITPSNTDEQTDKAIALSKILWSALMIDSDSEPELYQILNKLLPSNHEEVKLFASLYYHEMKPSITENEVQRLKKYYSNKEKFNTLNDIYKSLK